ncbi:hypothetical protein C8Q77DRAFT_1142941 [Trametes polyzona]|nr:hypothetical protein C8Q77DRAFT_1142941 [Trametes polyzona]
MATTTITATANLYEVLGIQKNATQEEVRKAYRRRALQTHPDRLPQNVSAADKKAAEEQFRLVNNAYEVLNNEENRKLYDKHGVWPPPAERPDYGRTDNHDSAFRADSFFNDPFFSSPFGSSSRGRRGGGFAFTDPFELFNSLFGDLHSAFDNDPFFAGTPFTRSPFDDPFFRSPFDSDPFFRSPFGGGSLFGSGGPFGALMGGSMFPQIEGGSGRVYSSRMEAVGHNGQWVSRSQMTRTINGRTEVITKKIDAQGNEHVTYSSPDGERYTINGVEQPTNRRIESNRRSETAPPPRQPPQAIADTPAQPASYYIPQQQQQQQAYSIPITSPAAAQAPPQTNAYLDRAHSHRSRESRHSSHRDRASFEDAPRRSYTQRTSSSSTRPPAEPRVPGHTHTRTDSAASAAQPTAAAAERIYDAHDASASATASNYAPSGHVPNVNGYDARHSGAYAQARDPRRDSVQSHHSGHSHGHTHSAASHRDSVGGKTAYPAPSHHSHSHSPRSTSRHDTKGSAYYPSERDRSGSRTRAGEQQPQPPQPQTHSQRGWRGWLSSVLHPLRHWHHGHHHQHDPDDNHEDEHATSNNHNHAPQPAHARL